MDKLVEKIADYLEQYSKDVRELDRSPSRWECENAAAELKDNLSSGPSIVEIEVDAELPPRGINVCANCWITTQKDMANWVKKKEDG